MSPISVSKHTSTYFNTHICIIMLRHMKYKYTPQSTKHTVKIEWNLPVSMLKETNSIQKEAGVDKEQLLTLLQFFPIFYNLVAVFRISSSFFFLL